MKPIREVCTYYISRF